MKKNTILAIAALAAFYAHCAPATNGMERARELGRKYLRTQDEADRRAWIAALDECGWDFNRRVRSRIDSRGVYKINRDTKLLCVVLYKNAADENSWDEDVEPDGTIHFEWKRKKNGGFDYKYSCPTNWEVFVDAYPGEVTRYGAKVTKARLSKTDPMPAVTLPDGWRVLEDEKYTGVNVREAFLMFEGDGTNLPPPRVSVDWGDVPVASVQGADKVEIDGSKASFSPMAAKPPVTYSTSFPGFGPIRTSLQHHIEGMQAGPYANYHFPSNEARSVANFVFAVREGFRRIGFVEKDSFAGNIWIGGFDSNYPNGHTDFPPHFHVIPHTRDGSQVHHFYVNKDDGRIESDCYQDMSKVTDTWDRVRTFRPGDTFPAFDGNGNVAYRVTMLKDGTGLEISAGGDRRFRAAGKRPCDMVELQLPDGDAWRTAMEVAVKDDPVAGTVETPEGTFRYDTATGRRAK